MSRKLPKNSIIIMSNYIKDLTQIFKAGVSAVLPDNLIRKSVNYDNFNEYLTVCGKRYELKNKRLYMIGTGKAVQNMAIEICRLLGNKIQYGIISIPMGSMNTQRGLSNILFLEGARNNLPDSAAEASSNKIKDLISNLTIDDVLLVLISGGGSALLPSAKKPITLEEKTALIKSIANAGADITELNMVRKRISDLKGGQLAVKAQPARVISMILSDIVGDPLDLIASGPTVENRDSHTKAIKVINKYKLGDKLPPSIKQVLFQKDKDNEFPKQNVSNYIIGCNRLSIEAALKEAKTIKYHAYEVSNIVTGDINHVAKEYIKLTDIICKYILGKLNPHDLATSISNIKIPGLNLELINNILSTEDLQHKPLCLILGGETTVAVKGQGLGGRNQQLALEFSTLLSDSAYADIFNQFDIYFLSAGTDGFDGPTDAAGAIGTNNLVQEAEKQGLQVLEYLENNDSYNFYKIFRNGEFHTITGHTNTNVMDLHLLTIAYKKKSTKNSNILLSNL